MNLPYRFHCISHRLPLNNKWAKKGQLMSSNWPISAKRLRFLVDSIHTNNRTMYRICCKHCQPHRLYIHVHTKDPVGSFYSLFQYFANFNCIFCFVVVFSVCNSGLRSIVIKYILKDSPWYVAFSVFTLLLKSNVDRSRLSCEIRVKVKTKKKKNKEKIQENIRF